MPSTEAIRWFLIVAAAIASAQLVYGSDVFSLVETAASSRTLLSSRALSAGHPFVEDCVSHRVYPLHIRQRSTWSADGVPLSSTLDIQGSVTLQTDAQAEPSDSICHYTLSVKLPSCTVSTNDGGKRQVDLTNNAPYWAVVEHVTAVNPVRFDQHKLGNITAVHIPEAPKDVLKGLSVDDEAISRGLEDAVWSLLYQLEFHSERIGHEGRARTSFPAARRGHVLLEGHEYSVVTTYSGEERIYEAAREDEPKEHINLFRVERAFRADRRKPASEAAMYLNRRVISENIVRPGVQGVAHSLLREVVTNVEDASIKPSFDPNEQMGGMNMSFRIEVVAVLGEPSEYLHELKQLLAEPFVFEPLDESTRFTPASTPRGGMRFRSMRSDAPASSSLQPPRFRSTEGGKTVWSAAWKPPEVKFGGDKHIAGFLQGSIETSFKTEEVEVGVGIQLGAYLWGQKHEGVKVVPGVKYDIKNKKREFKLSVEEPSVIASAATAVTAIKKLFGFSSPPSKPEPAEDAACGTTQAALEKPVTSYSLTFKVTPDATVTCLGGMVAHITVYGVGGKIQITFSIVPSLTIGADICKDKTNGRYGSLGLSLGGGFNGKIFIAATAAVPGVEWLLPPTCKPKTELGDAGIEGSLTFINLQWQVAYIAKLTAATLKTGCISTRPTATIMDGKITAKASAFREKLKWERSVYEHKAEALCIDAFRALARSKCLGGTGPAGTKITESGPEEIPAGAISQGLIVACGGEFISQQKDATPLWFRKNTAKKWEWTPFDKSYGAKRIWIPITQTKVPSGAPKWAGEAPVAANIRLIQTLAKSP